MRRCVFFFAAALGLCGLTARADYLYVKIDLSQVYQNIPTMAGGVGALPQAAPQFAPGRGPGPGRYPPAAGPRPRPPIPLPQNPNAAGQPLGPPEAGEGPFVYVTIEIKPKPLDSKDKLYSFEGKKDDDGKRSGAHFIDHPWGRNARFVETPTLTPGIIKYLRITQDSVTLEYARINRDLKGVKDPQRFLQAAMWALQHGLTSQFHAAMEDARKLDPKLPAVANYARVQAALKKPPAADDPEAKALIAEFSRSGRYHRVNGSGFYVALTNQEPTFDNDTKRRLNRLQETLENFYYWFALNDQLPQPALPQYRQLLLVSNTPEDFFDKHALWDSPVFTGDGVTPRRDNVILVSARPVDDAYRIFSSSNQELWKKHQIPQDEFLTGKVWKDGRVSGADLRDPFEIAFVQTLTIVQKAVEEECELATLSRQGTRQLLFASGLLPRHVHTPEWIAEGLASYFETPVGAPYRSVGLPSWSNLVAFKYLRITKKLDRPADALAGVVTDQYYRNSRRLLGQIIDGSDVDGKLSDRLREEMDLANSTAWAFAYYLVERRRQPQLLLRYCQELSAMPRDLDLDDRALEACFAKVFDMAQPNNPLLVDRAKFSALADAWFAEIAGVSLEIPEVQTEYLDVRKHAAKKKAAN
jgi:hypothetical protein